MRFLLLIFILTPSLLFASDVWTVKEKIFRPGSFWMIKHCDYIIARNNDTERKEVEDTDCTFFVGDKVELIDKVIEKGIDGMLFSEYHYKGLKLVEEKE